MKILKEWERNKELTKEIKSLRRMTQKYEQELRSKDEMVNYYMDKMHTYKSKCLDLRRQLLDIKSKGGE